MFYVNTELCLYSVELILLCRLKAIFKKAQIISLHWNFSLSIMICREQASSFLVIIFVLIGGIWGSRDGEQQTVSFQPGGRTESNSLPTKAQPKIFVLNVCISQLGPCYSPA